MTDSELDLDELESVARDMLSPTMRSVLDSDVIRMIARIRELEAKLAAVDDRYKTVAELLSQVGEDALIMHGIWSETTEALDKAKEDGR